MNKVFEIQYIPIAEEDLKKVFEYILADDPHMAVKILDQFDEVISHLANFPYMGTVPKDSNIARMNYRYLVIETYLVFYVVIEESSIVEIRRILGSRQKYDTLL
ncbi:MAG TPA: type II toxin-antitoxin system RelE/ParE family toxin [Bacillales bacterium]|nr:type II toxin-antitoxin system RelE/ParE family toxin [Bacillales bacterium]